MAVIGNTALTLADWAKRKDPDGKTATIVEMLSQTNEIMLDMRWLEGNLPTGHRTTVRTGLPSATWRRLNYGVQRSKSTTAQVTDETGILEARSAVDEDLAELNGNTAEFRLSESRAFIEGMTQEMAQTIIYGNSGTEPSAFTGLAPRYNDANAASVQNIINGGGTGADNTSIWLVVWGDQTVHGIFPKGSMAGLQHNDLGLDDEKDADGNEYRAYKDQYKWKAGLSVRDWRYAVRIANLDVSELALGNVDLISLMIKALHRLPTMGMGKACFYMNRTVAQYLDIQATNKNNVQLSIKEFDGEFINVFRGVPIRSVDAITNAEALVSGL